MRLSKVTAYATIIIYILILLVNVAGDPAKYKTGIIDSGGIIFFSLILIISQLYSLLAYRFRPKSLNNAYVGILCNISAVVSIYIGLAIYKAMSGI